jgi:hypothetical protein
MEAEPAARRFKRGDLVALPGGGPKSASGKPWEVLGVREIDGEQVYLLGDTGSPFPSTRDWPASDEGHLLKVISDDEFWQEVNAYLDGNLCAGLTVEFHKIRRELVFRGAPLPRGDLKRVETELWRFVDQLVAQRDFPSRELVREAMARVR